MRPDRNREARFCWGDFGSSHTGITKAREFGAKATETRVPPEFVQAFIEFDPLREAVAQLYHYWALRLVLEAFGNWQPIHQADPYVYTSRTVPDIVKAGAKPNVTRDHFRSRSCSTNIVLFRFRKVDAVLYVRFSTLPGNHVHWDLYSLHEVAEAQPWAGDGPCTLSEMVKAVRDLIR